ncbi:MAG: glutathione S-transferase N-terminal domain-containing protein [Parvibaculum sp.]|nr:glutathione S-transferase N-terminal domain-containing protein [Parvibaculum sp.]
MTLKTSLLLSGAPGSPYTRKMLAVLRYRHIPYRFFLSGHSVPKGLPAPKVALLPTFYLKEDGWMKRGAIPGEIRGLLKEVGRVYVPALRANAKALMGGAEQVDTEIDGKRWVQKPFPYQGKCLQWLREKHASLATVDRNAVDEILSGTGCEKLFEN